MTKVTSEIRIDAPRNKVWNVLADLGSVSVWNPAIAGSYYTSDIEEGVDASRHCDFPDGGYVKESATEWTSGESYTLEIYEGTVPFASAFGSFVLADDGEGTHVDMAIEYDLKEGISIDPDKVQRQNRDELLPLILAGLKQYVETGVPMTVPEIAEANS